MTTPVKTAVALFVSILSFVSPATTAEIAVIVNPSNSATISIDDVKSLFYGKQKGFSDGKTALVLSLSEGEPLRSEFNTSVLGKTDAQVKAYWSKLIFTGKGTPPKEVTAQEMLELVAKNPNTIGFVNASSVNDNVKVIATF